MRTRWMACSLVMLACLLLLSACGSSLAGTEWAVAGFVDELGDEQASVGANNAFGSLTLAFFEGQTGTLRMNETSYTFSYTKKGDTLVVTMQDGQQVQAQIDNSRIYWTLGDTTLYFDKK